MQQMANYRTTSESSRPGKDGTCKLVRLVAMFQHFLQRQVSRFCWPEVECKKSRIHGRRRVSKHSKAGTEEPWAPAADSRLLRAGPPVPQRP